MLTPRRYICYAFLFIYFTAYRSQKTIPKKFRDNIASILFLIIPSLHRSILFVFFLSCANHSSHVRFFFEKPPWSRSCCPRIAMLLSASCPRFSYFHPSSLQASRLAVCAVVAAVICSSSPLPHDLTTLSWSRWTQHSKSLVHGVSAITQHIIRRRGRELIEGDGGQRER